MRGAATRGWNQNASSWGTSSHLTVPRSPFSTQGLPQLFSLPVLPFMFLSSCAKVLLKTLNGKVLKVGNIFFKTNNTFPKSYCPHRNQMIFYILLCLLAQGQSLSFFSLNPGGLLFLTNLLSLLPWRHVSACCHVHLFPPLHWTIKDAQWWQEHVMRSEMTFSVF